MGCPLEKNIVVLQRLYGEVLQYDNSHSTFDKIHIVLLSHAVVK